MLSITGADNYLVVIFHGLGQMYLHEAFNQDLLHAKTTPQPRTIIQGIIFIPQYSILTTRNSVRSTQHSALSTQY